MTQEETLSKIKSYCDADIYIYIYGAGEVARLVDRLLRREGILPAGYVIDDEPAGNGIISRGELLRRHSPFVLVRGFLGSLYMSDDEIMRRWPGCREVFTLANIYEPDMAEPLTLDFFKSHEQRFMTVRESLGDDISKRSFDAYIEAKTTKDNTALLSCVVLPQYFFDDCPWIYSDTDILLDGGAFTGDSIADFVRLCGEGYQKIIACEPDPSNYQALLTNLRDAPNIETYPVGLYRKKQQLRFSSRGDMESAICESGDSSIMVDSIDGILHGQRVSIIKMDIEGAEMDALAGAEQTIKSHRPLLMISAYHKKDDIYSIFEFINRTVGGYRFYFRCHKPLPIDAVLYAIPEERIRESE